MELKLKNNSKLKFKKDIIVLDYIEVSNGGFSFKLKNKSILLNERFIYKFKSGTNLYLGWENQDQNDEYEVFTYNNQFYFDYRGRINGGTYASNTEYYLEIGNKYIKNLTTGSNIISGNSVTQSVTPKDFSVGTTNRFYFFKDYVGNELIHELLPVIYQGIVCVYDTISDTFFYNISVGTVVAGPESETQPYKNFPDDTKLKIISIFHQNTPNVNALSLIKTVVFYQKTHQEELILLNRIRADIGNVEGSLFDLLELASMAGFNDNYEPQAKPRLVGTWTINDWYTSEQLATAQAAFDGLTIVPDSNYLINFNDLAVQTLDDTQPNYNPAVAIILFNAGKGVVMDFAPISGQTGRWFITKNQASAITSISTWFSSKVDVTDKLGIVTPDTTATYAFSSFKEIVYFSNIILENTLWTEGAFNRCTKLKFDFDTIIPITKIGLGGHFSNISNLGNLTFGPYLTAFGSTTGSGDSSLFRNSTNFKVHLLAKTPPTIGGNMVLYASNYKFYVGDGSSAAHDNSVLAAYQAAAGWSNMTSYLDTWYNYLHPQS